MSTPPSHPLATAIRTMGDRRLTGALQVRGDVAGGTIWFHDGDITWARVAGRTFELDGTFAPEVLLSALSSRTADHDLGGALLEAGVPEETLVRFTAAVLEEALGALFRNGTVQVRSTREGNWFGTRCRFDADHWASRFCPTAAVDIDLRADAGARLSA